MSVFTACLPTTTGVYQNEAFWQNPLRRTTYLEQVRSAGYYCFGAGKVFHGTFDYATAGRQGAPNATWRESENRIEMWDEFFLNSPEPMPPARPLNGMFDFDRFDEVSPWNHHFDWGVLPENREAEMPDAQTVRRVTEFLANPPQQPFFCAAGFYKPHLPWYVPQRFWDMFPLEKISLPFVKEDDLDDVPAIARNWALNPPDHEMVTRHGQWRKAVRGYLAAIAYCDSQIGQIMAALANSPAADDTVVVLWSDNGFHLGEKLHWRKFVLWEEATRVPLIIVPAKGTPTAALVDEPVSLVDVWPTLCELAGIDQIHDVDGTSLAKLMIGQIDRWDRPAVMTWKKGNHSIRYKRWRYTRYRDGGEELYDRHNDPYEWTNLVTNSLYSAALANMRGQFAEAVGSHESS